jgi:hypothetical protein
LRPLPLVPDPPELLAELDELALLELPEALLALLELLLALLAELPLDAAGALPADVDPPLEPHALTTSATPAHSAVATTDALFTRIITSSISVRTARKPCGAYACTGSDQISGA